MNENNKQWVKRRGAANYLGVSTILLERLESERRIKYMSIPSSKGRVILYKIKWLDDFKKRHTIEIKQ